MQKLGFLTLAMALVAACAGYQPGSFQQRGQAFAPARVSLDCVDIAVAESPQPIELPVLEFTLANGCDEARVIDFAAVRLADAPPHDPRGELRLATLEARTVVTVVAAFDRPVGGALCVELDGLVRGAAVPARPLCVKRSSVVAEVSP